MKKLLTIAMILIAAFVMLPSCQKEILQKEIVKEITIDTTIKAGTHYFLALASYGDEGDVAKVIETPSFAATSTFENESDMFTSVYHYIPADDAVGKTDHVTISVIRGACKDPTLIYLNLKIE